MDVWEAIRGRRSIRRFADRPVERQKLERLVEAASWAPSGGNAQTWQFTVVNDPAGVRRLKTVSPGLLGDPPAVVAICQDLAEARHRGGSLGESVLAIADAAMATQNLLLAAHAEGLGTCVVASFHRGAVGRLLDLRAGAEPILLVSVGWPAETPPAPSRRAGRVSFTGGTEDVQ
jgi:nitroreductase